MPSVRQSLASPPAGVSQSAPSSARVGGAAPGREQVMTATRPASSCTRLKVGSSTAPGAARFPPAGQRD